MKFISRKGLDFQLWATIIRIKLAWYHKSNLGESRMLQIANNMNSARYSNYEQYKKYINSFIKYLIENLHKIYCIILYSLIAIILATNII